METLTTQTFSFGDFELDGAKRRLLKQGKPVSLNSKTFDLLFALVENHGQVLGKDELLEKVWAGQFVEENNLTVQISALRKLFGEKKGENRFIVTIPGRGYTFIAKTQLTSHQNDNPVALTNGHKKENFVTPSNFGTYKSIVGRDREITEIKNLLRRDEINLVTLTGMGGTGKTKLARAVADELTADFPDGVFFIELAAVNNYEFVVSVIAQTLGIKESGEKSPIETVQNFLNKRQLLLILDNFEQLLPAALLLQEIADSSRGLKILVTSRLALRLEIENEFVVTPLALPPQESDFSIAVLSDYSAIALFLMRAQTAKPNFVLTEENAPVVADICHKLDGLPLAIELAAARIKLLSPQAILDRLENSLKLLTGGAKDLPSRQQTMRGTVEWSYNLLDEDEKILFRRLAVFAGGFTVEAAEAIVEREKGRRGEREKNLSLSENFDVSHSNNENAKENLTETNLSLSPFLPISLSVLDLITSLADNNLLAPIEQTNGEMRLRMLEVVREFAFECLEKNGEAEILRQNHARFFLTLAEEADPHLTGEQAVEWLEKLEIEIDNLRAALRWSFESNAETAIRLTAALRYLWIYHSHLSEGSGWLKAALEQSSDAPTSLRFKLLYGLGILTRVQGDYAAARKLYQQALDEGNEAGDQRQIALSSSGLGTILQLQGDFAEARKYFEDGLEISRQLNDDYSIAYALLCLGIVLGIEGKSAEARQLLEESLAILRKIGSKESVSNNLNNLGAVAFDEGDYEAARAYFGEGLALSQEVGNKVNIIDALNGFAALAEQRNQPEQAAKLAGAAEKLNESVGFNKEPAERQFCETYIAKVRAALDEKTFLAAFEQGQAMNLSEASAIIKQLPPNVSEARYRTNNIFDPELDDKSTEIVIENHSFSRIIVDEEIEGKLDSPNGFEAKQFINVQTKTEENRRGWRHRNFVAALLGGFLLLGVIGGYFWRQSQSASLASAMPFAKPDVKQLTNNGKVSIAALSPDGKLFAYITNDLGLRSLWLGYTGGGNDIQLRPASETIYYDLAFSPDNSHLYFSVRDDQNPKNALYKMPAFGGGQEKVLDEIGNFSLSPDGNQIAFGRRNKAEEKDVLIVSHLSGAEQREIVSFPSSQSFIFNTISWSADGKRLAFSGDRDNDFYRHDLIIVEISNGEITRISSKYWRDMSKTAWLKDGSGLIVSAVKESSWASVPQYRVLHVEFPSGNVRDITTDLSSYGASLGLSENSDLLLTIEHRQLNNVWVAPCDDLSAARQITFSSFGKYDGLWGMDFAPDGKIIYTTSDTQSQLIAEMNAEGATQKQLTAPGFIDSVLNVSNDGRFIIFHSNRGGGFDVWRMNVDGSNPVQLTFGRKNFQPFISADNRWVYYKSWEKNAGELRRISIDGGKPEILNDKETSWLSFSPDGKFFAASYITDKQRVAVFSAETNQVVKQFDIPKGGTLFMGSRWTPDSQAVVYRDNAFGYWIQPLDGGEPKRLEGLPKEKFYNFAFSKDGKQFAFVRGQEIRDVVLFRHIKD